MKTKPIHKLTNESSDIMWCGFWQTGDMNTTNDWKSVTCKNCLKEYNKQMKPVKVSPVVERMSWSYWSYITSLIETEREKLHQNFLIAVTFLPDNSPMFNEMYVIYGKKDAELAQIQKSLYATVQDSYRNHPNKDMRKFWGIEK